MYDMTLYAIFMAVFAVGFLVGIGMLIRAVWKYNR